MELPEYIQKYFQRTIHIWDWKQLNWLNHPISDTAQKKLNVTVVKENERYCEAKLGYICTRSIGHKGPHIAHSDIALAVWVDKK